MKRLTLERQLRGWTQTELARQSYTSNTVINNAERGRRAPYEHTLKAIADALGWEGEPKDLLQDIKRGDVV